MRSLLFLLLVISTSHGDDSMSNDIPVMIYSRIKSNDISVQFPVASSVEAHEFKNYLTRIFPVSSANKNKKIAVIIVPSFDFADITSKTSLCPELKQNMYLNYPAVHTGYSVLMEYVNDNLLSTDILQRDTVDAGLELFCSLRKQKMSLYDGAVLTTLDMNAEENDPHVPKHRRSAAVLSNTTSDTMLFGLQCAALFNSIWIKNTTSSSNTLTQLDVDMTQSTFDCVNNDTATLKLVFNKYSQPEYVTQVSLAFKRLNFEWRLVNTSFLTAGETSRTLELVYMDLPYSLDTPNYYSLVCTSARFRVADPVNQKSFRQRMELYFYGLQFQPFDVANKDGSYTFGRVNYCSGFFTNGIWMGIVSTLVIAAGLAVGIYMMVGINTMDRFDDPKGRPLTIAAEK